MKILFLTWFSFLFASSWPVKNDRICFMKSLPNAKICGLLFTFPQSVSIDRIDIFRQYWWSSQWLWSIIQTDALTLIHSYQPLLLPAVKEPSWLCIRFSPRSTWVQLNFQESKVFTTVYIYTPIGECQSQLREGCRMAAISRIVQIVQLDHQE